MREKNDGILHDANMIIMQNSINQMAGFKDLEIHLDARTLNHFAE